MEIFLVELSSGNDLETFIKLGLIALLALTIISIVFHLVKIAIVAGLVMLFFGLSPAMLTNWIDSQMDPKAFGVEKIEEAPDNFFALPTDWIVTDQDGAKYMCNPDISPKGLGGIDCKFKVHSVGSMKGIPGCSEREYGDICKLDESIKLERRN